MIGDLLIGAGTGAVAGVVFFGGLRWTVEHLSSARNAHLWVTSSFLLRTLVVLALFLLISDGGLTRLLAGLGGLTLVRTAIVSRVQRSLGVVREWPWK